MNEFRWRGRSRLGLGEAAGWGGIRRTSRRTRCPGRGERPGTDVSGFGKDSTIAEQVADLIRSRGGEAIANDSDVSTPESGSDLIATTIEHFGRMDLLVNNAGIWGSQLFEDATLDDFDHYWRVHLGGPVNTVKAAWPYMVAQRYGKIILTTSVSGLFGLRGQATYAAAKCAVVGLMRILAIEGP